MDTRDLATVVFLVTNFLLVILGIILVAVGIRCYNAGNEFQDEALVTGSAVILGIGCIILYLAIIGCCGVLSPNYVMLLAFSVMVLLLVLIQMVGGVVAYVKRDNIGTTFRRYLLLTIDKGNKDNQELWDKLQKRISCCGVFNAADYTNVGKMIPVTCCPGPVDMCTIAIAFKQGCYEVWKKHWTHRIAIIYGIQCAISILGSVTGFYLAKEAKYDSEDDSDDS